LDWKDKDTIFLFEFPSGRRRVILKAEDHIVGPPKVSPDGAWLVFGKLQGSKPRWFIAPRKAAANADISEWIPLGIGDRFLYSLSWSARGDLIYALDGYGSRIMAIPLNGDTKYPSGPAFPVYELPDVSNQGVEVIISGDGLIVASVTRWQRNIWTQDLPR
jgi:hypothetical protein